uniref:Mitogen-activated protein kinase spm1 n=1 Tax=Talaromyces marneffei PM1 TaxID=1077442 RepID=A0A093UUE9_TALMA
MSDLQGRKVFKVFNQDFVVDERYNVTKELGQGAYGIVCAAVNTQTNEGVAIKKVTNVFSKKILAKRALREIKLLQHFRGHRNIACLYDMDIPRPDNFNETYLYEELMECDLAAIIRSGQPLTDAHFQSFIYQILCGLKYLHIWHDASDEPSCPTTFDFHFEVVDDVGEMRKMILDEVINFRAHVRQQHQAAYQNQQSQQVPQNVPIPENNQGPWKQEEPRPQEAPLPGSHQNDLEASLQRGSDFLH